jgi:hypothetical protein
VALPFTFKKYLKAKGEELWNFKYFTILKTQSSKKSSTKKPKSFKILLL